MIQSKFDDSVKEEIRSKADIVKVIGRYVQLKGKGAVLKGLCPFHNEKTPSFQVNPLKGVFYCFGCGKGGDVFKFLEEIESVSFFEAIKLLAEETGVELKQVQTQQYQSSSGSAPQLPKTELLKIHEIAAKFYYAKIRSFPEAINYFKIRGLAPETVRDFRLGFAPPGWSSLINHGESVGIPAASLVASGLAIEKEGGGIYDRFRNRVMFSLFDLSGRVVAFAGRGMSDNEMPKYLNSPETLLYKKKELLYGLHMARQAIKESGFAIVVEGYMDFLSLFQSGIRNVIAVSGTAFTLEHAHLLKRFCSKLILTFDGDSAGQQAARRAVPILAPADIDTSILILPDNEDPDEFIKRAGPDQFRELVKSNVRPWIPFIIDAMAREQDISTAYGKSATVSSLQPILQSITDPIVAHQFKKELSQRIGLDEKTIYTKVKFEGKMVAEERPQQLTVRFDGEERFSISLEGSFLNILLTSPELIPEARQYVIPETLTDSVSSDIYSLILEIFDEKGSIDGIMDCDVDPRLKRLIMSLLVKQAYPGHVHEELVQKIIHLRIKYIRDRIRDAKLKMKDEPHRRAELLKEMQDFTTQLQELQKG